MCLSFVAVTRIPAKKYRANINYLYNIVPCKCATSQTLSMQMKKIRNTQQSVTRKNRNSSILNEHSTIDLYAFCTLVPWFMNNTMYPIKMKKCLGVANRFFRSERALDFRDEDIFISGEDAILVSVF